MRYSNFPNVVDYKMPCILEIKLYSPVQYTVLNFGISSGGPSLCPFLTGAQADQMKPNLFLSSKLAAELSQTAEKCMPVAPAEKAAAGRSLFITSALLGSRCSASDFP